MFKIKSITIKQKRMLIGITMMFSFISLAQTLYLCALLGKVIGMNALLSVFYLNYLWLPAVFYIFLSYYVLTKIYPYEEVKNDGLESSQMQTVQK